MSIFVLRPKLGHLMALNYFPSLKITIFILVLLVKTSILLPSENYHEVINQVIRGRIHKKSELISNPQGTIKFN